MLLRDRLGHFYIRPLLAPLIRLKVLNAPFCRSLNFCGLQPNRSRILRFGARIENTGLGFKMGFTLFGTEQISPRLQRQQRRHNSHAEHPFTHINSSPRCWLHDKEYVANIQPRLLLPPKLQFPAHLSQVLCFH